MIKEKKAKQSQIKVYDGPREVIVCSMCHQPLIEVWITNPDVNQTWQITADCPYCPNEKSYMKEVRGKFYYGPIFIDKHNSEFEGDDIQITSIKEIVTEGNKVHFHMEVKKNG